MSTKTKATAPKIKPLLNFGKLAINDLLGSLFVISDAMTGNANFPNPPVDMATFKTAIDTLKTLSSDAQDGGKKAVSASKKQREAVIKMAIQTGHYVWSTSNNDLAIFNTSGFQAASN